NIKIEESQVKISLGALRIASGQFDITLGTELKSEEDDTPFSELDALAIGHAHQQTRTYSLSQSLSKTFRYGTSLDGSIGIERTDNRYPGDTPNTDNGVISFSLTQPLFKGRGLDATGANEASKREAYEAEQYTLRQTVSQKIYETVTAYWNYRGAQDTLTVLEASKKNIEKSIQELKALIDGGEKPASDLNNYLATLAIRDINLLSARQNLFSLAQTLAVAMGIPYTQKVDIPSASEEYPNPDTSILSPPPQWLTDMALTNRSDLGATEKNLTAAKHLMIAAQNGMLPQLDLSLEVKLSDVVKGDYDQNATSASAWLNYDIPVGNNVAAGQMLTARSGYNQILYQIEGLKRTICSQVNNSVDALITYCHIRKQYEAALDLDKQIIKEEKIQYTLGTSNLINVISVEDNLTTDHINLINSRTNVANALIELRYVTGTILAPDQTEYRLNRSFLTTIPENISN
ncbi:MAG: TolC family protein, partial [Proteobacteria bacterium]|nr:TolC family protein [Pseudomonadota bacterium]